MPDTPDVDALVRSAASCYVGADGWGKPKAYISDSAIQALSTLADLARKATTPPVEGYDWRKDLEACWWAIHPSHVTDVRDRLADYIEQQQAALTAANARADEAEAALAAEREVSATYARVGDEMKSRGEARIKELEGERDWLADNLAAMASGDCPASAGYAEIAACAECYGATGVATKPCWLAAAAREAVKHG